MTYRQAPIVDLDAEHRLLEQAKDELLLCLEALARRSREERSRSSLLQSDVGHEHLERARQALSSLRVPDEWTSYLAEAAAQLASLRPRFSWLAILGLQPVNRVLASERRDSAATTINHVLGEIGQRLVRLRAERAR